MVGVLGKNISIGLDPRRGSAAVTRICRDLESLAGILIDPLHSQPFLWIQFKWRNQMKSLGVSAERMPQWTDVACEQEIERLDLIAIVLPSIQFRQRFEQLGTGYG